MPKTTLLLSGRFSPANDIGSELKFEVLRVPWTKKALSGAVMRILSTEFHDQGTMEDFRKEVDEVIFRAACHRGVGINAWILSQTKYPRIFLNALEGGWSGSFESIVRDEVNRIATKIEPVSFRWPKAIPNDVAALDELESLLLSCLKMS